MSIIDEKLAKQWLGEDPNYRNPRIGGSVLTLPAAELLGGSAATQIWFELQELPDDVAEALEKHTGDLTMEIGSLTPFAARCLAQRKYRKNTHWRLYVILNRLEAAEAAELARTRYPLLVDIRGELSDGAAEVLAKYEGDSLYLQISELSDAAVEALATYRGDLDLNGLKKLSDAAADSLCKHKGDLSIGDWLETCSDAARKTLSRKSGTINGEEPEQWAIEQVIRVQQGLSELSDAAAEIISRYEGEEGLELNALTKLSDTAAEALLRYEGSLGLEGLTELSDGAAESLAKRQGELCLNGLTKLSDAAAESLSKHQGELVLDGMKKLSDVAAESLSKHQGWLSLDGLAELSDAVAESLSKHKGDLSLGGLNGISDTAAVSLSSYEGQISFQTPKEWVEYQKYLGVQGKA